MSTVPDRLETLRSQQVLTGIDFVYVSASQTVLEVHFHVPPSELTLPLLGTITADDVRIYDPAGEVADVHVVSDSWVGDVWRLQVPSGGDFTRYRLCIYDARIDPFFNDVDFSFKANCPTDLDCAPAQPDCPPDEHPDVAIDYTARDFWSYRQALLDMVSLRHPHWTDRLEADAGIMMAEVMSVLADEMAYYQDRVSREAYLDTATQRRSLRRHARLVDFEIQDSLGARTWLDVTALAEGDIAVGADVWSQTDAGQTHFEVGTGLFDETGSYRVLPVRNSFEPYRWDEDDVCLPVGATELTIKGHHAADIMEENGTAIDARMMLLWTQPVNPSQPERRFLVRVIAATDETDPVFGEDFTRIRWEQAQATPFELDKTCLTVRGNIIPATSGQTVEAFFFTGGQVGDIFNAAMLAPQKAVERNGSNGSTAYLFSLPGTENVPIVRFAADSHRFVPEMQLDEIVWDGSDWETIETWKWQHSMIGLQSSRADERHFTLDDGQWRRVVGYQKNGAEFVHHDYVGNAGHTIRFGDNMFGLTPAEGTLFRVRYRVGGGKSANLAHDTLTHIENPGFIDGVTNPLPAEGGTDAQTADDVRRDAPEAYRAITYRAVRPEDYAEAVERLDFVQKAGASFRWTGSWLTAFATPDPKAATTLTDAQRTTVEQQLDRFRQAGREAHVLEPDYADLDLKIMVCVQPNAYAGEVKGRVLQALTGKNGFFSPDRFTFGQPLDRSALEAAIQQVAGVRAVEGIRFRQRGKFVWRDFTEMYYHPGASSIIRVENDPLHPDRGTVNVYMHGGS